VAGSTDDMRLGDVELGERGRTITEFKCDGPNFFCVCSERDIWFVNEHFIMIFTKVRQGSKGSAMKKQTKEFDVK
jgi:hypothetical protein